MTFVIDAKLKERFPGLQVLVCSVKNVSVNNDSAELQEFKDEVAERVRKKYNLESLKDESVFRAYRDFFWQVGIDPTKNRPAGEALIRRILSGKSIPKINTFVDAYNLASIDTGIAIGAFDADELQGDLTLRFAREGEEFVGIGMEKSIKLKGNEMVVSDAKKLIAIYPYRDADSTKIIESTKNVLLLICGAPEIDEKILNRTAQVAIEYVTRFCGGEGKIVN